MALDERLRRELEGAGRPADPSGVYEELIRRRERRRLARVIRATALVAVVVTGSIAGLYGLSRVFQSVGGDPAGGPPNGLIVYSDIRIEGFDEEGANVVDDWHLYTVDPSDGEITRIGPDSVGSALYPTWSPDGERLAFVGFPLVEDGPPIGNVYVADADGTNLELILRTTDQQQIEGLRWSPDGSWIGYQLSESASGFTTVADQSWTVWTIAPDGSDRRPITTTGREMHFSWSPDSTSIVFERIEPVQDESELGQAADLFIVDVESGEETRLTDDGMSRDPAWSPDGTEIAFSHGPRGGQHIALIDVDGGGLREIDAARAEAATFFPYGNTIEWAPDGTEIAFTGHGIDDVCFISTIDLRDERVRRLVSSPASESCPGQEGMSWAPAVTPEIGQSLLSPSPSVDLAESPGPPAGEDIGIGFPVCNVSVIDGEFAESSVNSTVFVATRMGDTGGCPQPEDAFNVIALDTDGDQHADTSFGPIECVIECRAFSSPDIDGDGTEELLVVQSGGSVVGIRLYDFMLYDVAPSILPVTVAEPGDPDGGFEPAEQPMLYLGGDGFGLNALTCGELPAPDGPGIVATSAESLPHDSPEAEWHAHQTTFVLRDGQLRVVDVRDFTEPVTDDPSGPSFRSDETLCGSNLGP